MVYGYDIQWSPSLAQVRVVKKVDGPYSNLQRCKRIARKIARCLCSTFNEQVSLYFDDWSGMPGFTTDGHKLLRDDDFYGYVKYPQSKLF